MSPAGDAPYPSSGTCRICGKEGAGLYLPSAGGVVCSHACEVKFWLGMEQLDPKFYRHVGALPGWPGMTEEMRRKLDTVPQQPWHLCEDGTTKENSDARPLVESHPAVSDVADQATTRGDGPFDAYAASQESDYLELPRCMGVAKRKEPTVGDPWMEHPNDVYRADYEANERRIQEDRADAYLAQMQSLHEKRRAMKRTFWGQGFGITTEDRPSPWADIIFAWLAWLIFAGCCYGMWRLLEHYAHVWSYLR